MVRLVAEKFEIEEELMENEIISKNFIEQEIDKDLSEGVYDHVCTVFPRNRTVIFT